MFQKLELHHSLTLSLSPSPGSLSLLCVYVCSALTSATLHTQALCLAEKHSTGWINTICSNAKRMAFLIDTRRRNRFDWYSAPAHVRSATPEAEFVLLQLPVVFINHYFPPHRAFINGDRVYVYTMNEERPARTFAWNQFQLWRCNCSSCSLFVCPRPPARRNQNIAAIKTYRFASEIDGEAAARMYSFYQGSHAK